MISEVAQGTWFRGWTFSFAVAGVAVGMHSFWRLPALAMDNGGAVFLLAYLLALVLLAAPLLGAEIMLGRSAACEQSAKPAAWRLVVWLGCVTSLLLLSLLTVYGSLSLAAVVKIASGDLVQAGSNEVAASVNGLLSSSNRMVAWQSVFLAIPVSIMLLGVSRGTGFVMRLLIPLGLLLLLILLAHNVSSGALVLSDNVLYQWRMEEFSWQAMKSALILAFFSVSAGTGAVLALSNYLPDEQPVRRALTRIVLLIVAFSVLSGWVVQPLLAKAGVAMSEGPTLLFLSLPMAFAATVQGDYFGSLFFVLLSTVAIASALALLEPATRALTRLFLLHRSLAVVTAGVTAWLLAMPSVLSFNEWASDGRSIFESIDLLCTLVLIPGLVFWIAQLQASQLADYLHGRTMAKFRSLLLVGWMHYLRYITPLLLIALVIELAQRRGLLV